MKRMALLLLVTVWLGLPACIRHVSGAESRMKKSVTNQASFIVYLPEGWKSTELLESGCRILKVSDATGQYEAAIRYGISPVGDNVLALSKVLIAKIAGQFPDLQVLEGKRTKDSTKIVFDGSYTHPQKGNREFRSWVSVGTGGQFTFTTMEGPPGQLATKRQVLLTILANVRLTKGAFTFKGSPPAIQPLVARRLNDGSASAKIPQDWTLHDVGKTQLIATGPNGSGSFIVGIVDIASPQIGDYQRTNYIRGQQDWISTMEGGTIYHTDSWGTLNTDTGVYLQGKAYDYVHFQGDNPKYNEQMMPIDSRQLWERHVR